MFQYNCSIKEQCVSNGEWETSEWILTHVRAIKGIQKMILPVFQN